MRQCLAPSACTACTVHTNDLQVATPPCVRASASIQLPPLAQKRLCRTNVHSSDLQVATPHFVRASAQRPPASTTQKRLCRTNVPFGLHGVLQRDGPHEHAHSSAYSETSARCGRQKHMHSETFGRLKLHGGMCHCKSRTASFGDDPLPRSNNITRH